MRDLHVCGKKNMHLAPCSPCDELEGAIAQLREDFEECCNDVQGRIDALDSVVSGLSSVSFEAVDELPETGEPNVIYLVPDPNNPETRNQYVYVDGEFVEIGSTEVDLSGYVTDVKVNNSSVVTSGVANIDLSGYATNASLNNKQNKIASNTIDFSQTIAVPDASETSDVIYTASQIGIYVGLVCVDFPSNSTGRRGVAVFNQMGGGFVSLISRENTPALNGINTRITIPVIQSVIPGYKFGLQLYQNSGGVLSASVVSTGLLIPTV